MKRKLKKEMEDLKPEELENQISDFVANLEFDFSNRRSQKRTNYLTKNGVPKDDIDDTKDDYIAEEGMDEEEIHRNVKK
jgi:hypothetical protein